MFVGGLPPNNAGKRQVRSRLWTASATNVVLLYLLARRRRIFDLLRACTDAGIDIVEFGGRFDIDGDHTAAGSYWKRNPFHSSWGSMSQ